MKRTALRRTGAGLAALALSVGMAACSSEDDSAEDTGAETTESEEVDA